MSWKHFQDKLQTSHDLEEIIQAHYTYLAELCSKLFLDQEHMVYFLPSIMINLTINQSINQSINRTLTKKSKPFLTTLNRLLLFKKN